MTIITITIISLDCIRIKQVGYPPTDHRQSPQLVSNPMHAKLNSLVVTAIFKQRFQDLLQHIHKRLGVWRMLVLQALGSDQTA